MVNIFLLVGARHLLAQGFGSDNIPIAFYGKVVDQDGQPLTGAVINMGLSVGELTPVPEAPGALLLRVRSDKATAETGTNGLFSLVGFSGRGVEIKSIIKKGYKLSDKTRLSYITVASAQPFHSDPNNPVVFKMWKREKREALIVNKEFFGVPPDGQSVTIDFVELRKTVGIRPGDIIVRIKRPPTIEPHTRFDWSCSIKAVDGGLIHTDDEFLYEAPSSGYKPEYDFVMAKTNSGWVSEVKNQQFYLKSRNGAVYGSLVVEVVPKYNKVSSFNVTYIINPAASRNLEP